MDLAELADVVGRRLSYWPGWEFTAYADPHLGLMLRIVTTRPSRDDPGQTVNLGGNARIPPHALAGEGALARWVLWRLVEVAVREVREGLRLDGHLVDDPHV